MSTARRSARATRNTPPEVPRGTVVAAYVTDLALPNIGDLHPVGQEAIASDAHNALAMLRRCPGESLADVEICPQ